MSHNAPCDAQLSENDRLLLLAGECEHGEWRDEVFVREPHGMTRLYATCGRCGCTFPTSANDTLPAVGDGWQMTLGEMVRLWAKLAKGYWADIELHVFLAESGKADEWRATVKSGKHGTHVSDYADSPEAALTRAILAATESEQR